MKPADWWAMLADPWTEGAAVPVPVGFCQIAGGVHVHRAVATRRATVIVVEGFFDCLKVYQAGFNSVVALMGPALYEHQRRLPLQRFRQIVPMLDGDAAGRRATGIPRRC